MTAPAPDGPLEQRIADLAAAHRDAETALHAAVADAFPTLSAYRIAQLTGRSANGIRHIIRKHQEKP